MVSKSENIYINRIPLCAGVSPEESYEDVPGLIELDENTDTEDENNDIEHDNSTGRTHARACVNGCMCERVLMMNVSVCCIILI